ncbi:MAG: hypothetical protein MUF51_04325, partial [Vicinamibacteria bacterium]|nr:hypothetical protein [Vicinamibacteria bacterium]
VLTALSLATFAPAAVTFVAYLAGHPEKARYCLLLASSLALLLAVATARRPVLQIVALGLALTQTLVIPRPLPVLREATRDRQDVLDRRPVTARIRQEYRGGRILVSMGSLAPVIFELGLPIREIVHEGNGYGWDCAMINPKQEVSWVIARDGDVLERMHAYRPDFPEGFVAVMRVSRFVVYRRASDLLPQRAARPASRTTQAG